MNTALCLLIAIPIGLTNPPFTEMQSNSFTAQVTQTSENTLNTSWFSMRYPSGWIVGSLSDDYVILYNQPPDRGDNDVLASIKTDISLTSIPFENLPASSPRYDGETITRTESLTINGRQAVRAWTEGGEAYTNALITYIRYTDQQTAFIVSFYYSQNTEAEATIESVHNSFSIFR